MRWTRRIQIGDRVQIPSDYLKSFGLRKGDVVVIEEKGKKRLEYLRDTLQLIMMVILFFSRMTISTPAENTH